MKPTAERPDTILDEIHETRRRLLQQHGGVAGLAAFLRKREAATAREIREPETTPGGQESARRPRNRPAADA